MGLSADNDGLGLLIGLDRETGQKQFYYGERGLATIAAPGSGKTQCHMLPNLMTWHGPAIVLDVTGELYRKTSAQRSRFGPVYKFDVDDTGTSDHYNPFDLIRDDPRHAWGDSLSFAELLYSRTTAGSETRSSGFFDQATPVYLAALACFIALEMPEHRRNGETLLLYASGADRDDFMNYAKSSGILGMKAMAATLAQADKETLGNVLWTAKNSLGPWEQPDIAELTRVSDWEPEMVRDHSATLYIRAPLDHLNKHPGLVRLLIGQHLQIFMRKAIDRDATPWVQFFLDEVPQLRHMDVLVRAIEGGRNFNLRCWLVMQWRGQLIAAYGRDIGDGMIASCGLQAYFNPSLEDGMAQALSDRIGVYYPPAHHPHDQTQRPKVTAQTLAGLGWSNSVIAFDDGELVRLDKRYFKDDTELRHLAKALP